VGLHAQTATSFPRDTTYTTYQAWAKIKKNYPQVKIPVSLNSPLLVENLNLVYAALKDSNNVQRELHLDIFRPSKPGKYPALIMVHGGGWRSGNKSMEGPMAQRIAQHGYVAIPVEYRLSLEARYPAAVHDIKAAIRWIKTNADKYDIDTTRIAIEGNSAGGQLATLVGMTGHDTTFEGTEGVFGATSRVHAVVDIDGVVDFLSPASIKIPRKPDATDAFWLGGTFETRPDRWKEASPIFHIDEHAVPVLFITSAQPRFHAGRDEMIDLLNQYKVYSESHNIPDSPHSFWLFEPWFDPTANYMVAFLDTVFK
jgi:pectinesterase